LLIDLKMMIPLRDILATEKQKAFRFGHHGLVVVIKGHEELFFEFNSLDRRNAVAQIVESLLEELREKQHHNKTPSICQEKSDALILQTLEPVGFVSDSDIRPPTDSMSDSLPAVMFTSSSSTFLTFKPPEPLHFTCLTIGSRGDVQPYIALCKRLKADGHRVRIATHLEFKDWIEGVSFIVSSLALTLSGLAAWDRVWLCGW
jgi:sterol 3beta-glucosyltransferase